MSLAVEFLPNAYRLGDGAVLELAQAIEAIGYDEIDLFEHVTMGLATATLDVLCCDAGLECDFICIPQRCGGEGEPCGGDANFCFGALVCTSIDTCAVACGGEGQPCCAGGFCGDDLACESDQTRGQSGGGGRALSGALLTARGRIGG